MVCESWKAKLDTYLDGELPSEEMRTFGTHVHSCPFCAADALVSVQLKRSIQAAGKRFAPNAEFRKRVQQSITAKPRRGVVGFGWMIATAMIAILVVVGLAATYLGRQRADREQVYSELADLHVATLASSSPVDVVSSDQHTVKPWFQGRIPFTFDLPELRNSEFSLLGGRITYLGQTPGAHLIYELRKHEISVFIFREGSLRGTWDEEYPVTKELSFNMETWSQGGLRYCLIGDASRGDLDKLAGLLKHAGS
ncbi:MAG TPA: zf-HC2 domain-containing protein [Terriglobales bacterium]|nr:zf-HC2 domain-containing protein [Terriglobales bacterium]